MGQYFKPLSDNELESICLNYLTVDLPYFPQFREAFRLLYITGARVEEIFDISRWHLVVDDTYEFLPQKGNYERTVILSSDFESFKSAVSGQFKPFAGLSVGQFNRLFFAVSPHSSYFVDSKPISLYLFRYAFMRRLFRTGLTLNQIADKMGYTSTQVVAGYLENTIDAAFFFDDTKYCLIGTRLISKYPSDWTNMSLNVTQLQPLNGAPVISYFTLLGANQFFSANPNFNRLTLSDVDSIRNYLFSMDYDLRALLEPDSRFWANVNVNMLNLFNYQGRGYGVIAGSRLYDVKQFDYTLFWDESVNRYRVLSMSPAIGQWFIQETTGFLRYPVRYSIPY